jgi:vancomycin resistance protein YoaR
VLLGSLLGTTAVANAGVVLNGIIVGGIPVAGLGPEDLIARLTPAARALQRRPITLYVGARQWVVTPDSIGVSVDLKATADRALGAGRQSSIAWLLQSMSLTQRKLGWVPKVDPKRLISRIHSLADEVRTDASNGDVVLTGSKVEVKAPKEGITLLSGPARSALITAAMRPSRSDRLPLPVNVTAPDIDQQEANQVQQQAETILASPEEFTFQGQRLMLPPDRVAKALRVRVAQDDGSGKGASLVLEADPDALREQIVAQAPFVSKPPRDAFFTVAGDKVTLVPSQDGTTIETGNAASQLITAGRSRKPIDLPAIIEPAALTTEAAQGLGINTRISTFTTDFDVHNVPRVANIDRMASTIDGKVLMPGQTFSLNDTTGPRTPANGYQEAKVIVDGELVPGIGGGVCQVATTVFNAVYEAGLDVISRTNHSLHIDHYPMGRDATVNYGHQDLQFRNDTPYGLLLKAAVSNKFMTVSIFSSPLGRTVKSEVGQATNPKVPPVKYVDDPTIPTGTENVVEEGKPGFDISVKRIVTQDGQVLHSDTFVSKYSPWKRIINKGTGPVAPASPAPGVVPQIPGGPGQPILPGPAPN